MRSRSHAQKMLPTNNVVGRTHHAVCMIIPQPARHFVFLMQSTRPPRPTTQSERREQPQGSLCIECRPVTCSRDRKLCVSILLLNQGLLAAGTLASSTKATKIFSCLRQDVHHASHCDADSESQHAIRLGRISLKSGLASKAGRATAPLNGVGWILKGARPPTTAYPTCQDAGSFRSRHSTQTLGSCLPRRDATPHRHRASNAPLKRLHSTPLVKAEGFP